MYNYGELLGFNSQYTGGISYFSNNSVIYTLSIEDVEERSHDFILEEVEVEVEAQPASYWLLRYALSPEFYVTLLCIKDPVNTPQAIKEALGDINQDDSSMQAAGALLAHITALWRTQKIDSLLGSE